MTVSLPPFPKPSGKSSCSISMLLTTMYQVLCRKMTVLLCSLDSKSSLSVLIILPVIILRALLVVRPSKYFLWHQISSLEAYLLWLKVYLRSLIYILRDCISHLCFKLQELGASWYRTKQVRRYSSRFNWESLKESEIPFCLWKSYNRKYSF